MNYIYILFVLIFMILLVRRKIDFLSIGVVCFILYTIPCLFKETYIVSDSGFYYYSLINDETYLCVFLQMLVIVFFLFKEDYYKNKLYSISTIEYKSNLSFLYLVAIIADCFLLNDLSNIGIGRFFSTVTKSELLDELSLGFSLFLWGDIVALIFAIKNYKLGLIILSLPVVLFSVVLGSRAYIALVLVCLLVVKQKTLQNKRIPITNIKYLFVGIFSIFFLMLYKKIFVAVRSLDYIFFQKLITGHGFGDLFASSLSIGEFRCVFSLYDYTIFSELSLPFEDFIARILSFIPTLGDILGARYPIRYSKLVVKIFDSTYGLASNFWAETMAMGGPIFLVFITFIWLTCLQKANTFLIKNNIVSTYYIVFAAWLSFYIHRLDWVQISGLFKILVFFIVLNYIWIYILKLKIYSKNNIFINKYAKPSS